MIDVTLLTRLAWALALIAGGVLLYRLFSRLTLARLAARPAGRRPGLETAVPGVPLLVYFTTPTCAPCKSVQRPAIQRLQAQVGAQVQVIEINAAEQPDVAGVWGVLSVPTTFVLAADGTPRHVNHGVTGLDKLARQVADVL